MTERFAFAYKKSAGKVLTQISLVILALFIGGVIITALGFDPVESFKYLIKGSFGTKNAIGETVVKMTPLILTGLSFALANRCGMINIGAEGQLYMGGFFAAAAGLYFDGLPMFLHLTLGIVAGFVGGGLWGVLAGWLKVKYNASEIITTIMLNYVAMHLISFLVSGPMIEPPGTYPQTPHMPDSAILPKILTGTRMNLGFIIAILMVVLYYIFLWKTTKGFETRVVGQNPEAARYVGMKPKRSILLAMFMSGGFAGLAGMTEILGVQGRMFAGFSPGYGFDGIAVALLGQNNPIGIVLSSALFGAIRSGSNLMQSAAQVPVSVNQIIQALVIIFVAGSQIVAIVRKKQALKKTAKQEGGGQHA